MTLLHFPVEQALPRVAGGHTPRPQPKPLPRAELQQFQRGTLHMMRVPRRWGSEVRLCKVVGHEVEWLTGKHDIIMDVMPTISYPFAERKVAYSVNAARFYHVREVRS